MKRFLRTFALLTVMSLFVNTNLEAQSVNINVNIGNQPAWGPVGYDYARYYYFPDIDVYYDVNNSLFYYWERGSWRGNRYLPYRYNQYDLYRMYKVVINQPTPWRYHDRYHTKYANYRGNHTQVIILNSPDRRYDPYRGNRVEWVNLNQGKRPNHNVSNSHPGNGNNRPNTGKPNQNNSNNRPNNNQPNNNRPGSNQQGGNVGKPNDKFSGNGVGRPTQSNTNQRRSSSSGRTSTNDRSNDNRATSGRSNAKEAKDSGRSSVQGRIPTGGR